jgi:putative transposase
MELFHALNRGVDKRTIFHDSQDYARFVHNMFEFNSTLPAKNVFRNMMSDIVNRSSTDNTHISKKLVDIHGWCLMNNHYHLLLSERIEGGLSQFLRKLNVGYAKYFNERYKRSGTLFQGRTKKILIDNDAHFLHILNYIHFNPLDTLEGAWDWRERKITQSNEALDLLQKYRWSSYLDYIKTKNFPSILTTSLFLEVFNNDYKGQVEKYLSDISSLGIQHLFLETTEKIK